MLAYPLKIIVNENMRVAIAPAVCASGNAAMIICANVLAKTKISMQKSNISP
jgi:hypothetical protein